MIKGPKCSLKSFIAGFLVAIIISTLFNPVLASYIYKTITVQTGINVYNDGKLLDLTDANGNKVEPFLYDGTTYLPVRAIVGAIGKSISWDDETSSVYIGTNDDKYIKPDIIKNDPDNGKSVSIFQNYWSSNSPFKVNGNIITSNAFGVRFAENVNNSCAYFSVDNSNLNYKKISWYVANDDISKNKVSTVAVGVNSGYCEILSNLTSEKQKNGLVKYTADISNMQKIVIYILPSFRETNTLYVDSNSNPDSPLNLNKLGKMTDESYAVFVGPYVK